MNPITIRVYYDEEENRENEYEVMEELETTLDTIDGVLDIEINVVFMLTPIEAEVEIEFDESVMDSDELRFEIASQPFIHNAIKSD